MFNKFAQRAVNIDVVLAELSNIFLTRTTAEWIKLLDDADVPSLPMHSLESMLTDPHLMATDFFPIVEHPSEGPIRNMKVSATWSKTPVETPRLGPALGEHGAEILAEVGYSAEEIAKLTSDGVIRTPSPDLSQV
jgi:crotonobetainyl-CoA:carnitine CoA-transferase CaiB-like acyl-CoA transferase